MRSRGKRRFRYFPLRPRDWIAGVVVTSGWVAKGEFVEQALPVSEAASDPLLSSLSREMDIDVSDWFRVGGTGAGGYYQASSDVLVAVPRPDFVQTEEVARRSLAEFQRIAAEIGRPQSIIVLVDRVLSQDSKSRRVWSEEEGNRLRRSLALVCRSGLSRAIGSFFIGLYRPGVPTKMFKSFDEALEWSKLQGGRGS